MKKSIKLILGIALILVLALGVIACEPTKPGGGGGGGGSDNGIVITLSQTSASIHRGNTLMLTAEVKGADAEEIMWSSANDQIATVAWNGLVTAMGQGETTITAKIDDVKAECKVTVTAPDYSSYTKISTKEEMLQIKNDLSGKYVLTQDIDWGGVSLTTPELNPLVAEWVGDRKPFAGVLDGNGHKIYNAVFGMKSNNANQNRDKWNNGLFWQVSGTVESLTIEIDTFVTDNQGGAVCFKLASGGLIKDVNVIAKDLIFSGFAEFTSLITSRNEAGIIRDCIAVANWSEESSAQNIGKFVPIAANSGGTYSNNTVIINNTPSPQDIFDDTPETTLHLPQFGPISLRLNEAMALDNYKLSSGTTSYEVLQGTCVSLEGTTLKAGAEDGNAILRLTFGDVTANGMAAYLDISVEVGDPSFFAEGLSYQGTDIQWTANPLAISYTLEFTDSDNKVEEIEGITALNYDASARIINPGKYSVRIKIIAKGGESKDYGKPMDIYAINSLTGLKGVNADDRARSRNYLLIGDIDFGGVSAHNTVSRFTGVLDGNGYKLHNFTSYGQWGYGGIFKAQGEVETSGTIRNLSVYCNDYKVSTNSGILVDILGKGGLIDNVYVYAESVSYASAELKNFAGLVTGINKGTISNTVEVANWVSGTPGANSVRFFRLGKIEEEGKAVNNYSIINNAPAEIENQSPQQNKVISSVINNTISLATGEKTTINTAVEQGYQLELIPSDDEVITMGDAGEVTAVAEGTAYITVRFGTVSQSIGANGSIAELKILVTVTASADL